MSPSDLERGAPLFRALDHPSDDARPFYDALSDAIVWTDELPEEDPAEWWDIRPLLRHRTCMIVGERSEFEAWWLKGKELFPQWVGFSQERSAQSPRILQIYENGRADWDTDLPKRLGAE